jgi:diacylglycerol kinase
MPGVTDSEVQRRKDQRPRMVMATALGWWRRDSALRRRVLLGTIAMTVGVTMLVTVILTVVALSSSASTPDRLAAAGDVLVGATLLLAIIAALVALLAYAVSTGLPDLELGVQFGNTAPDVIVFTELHNGESKELFKSAGLLQVKTSYGGVTSYGSLSVSDSPGKVFLHNQSGYSAQNPALIIRLHGIVFRPNQVPTRGGTVDNPSFADRWTVIDSEDFYFSEEGKKNKPDHEKIIGYKAIQWDGGPTYSIHGHSTRRLPDLDFDNLWLLLEGDQPSTPYGWSTSLTFEILAEGYRKEISLPVEIFKTGTFGDPPNGN